MEQNKPFVKCHSEKCNNEAFWGLSLSKREKYLRKGAIPHFLGNEKYYVWPNTYRSYWCHDCYDKIRVFIQKMLG